MSRLTDLFKSGPSKGERRAAALRAQKAAAAKAAAAKRARDAAAKKAAQDKARAQAQAQAQAKAEAERRAAEAAEKARIEAERRAAQELSDKRVAEFNTSLSAAKKQGSKEIQMLRVTGLKSEDERVRELAGGITENKATALDAPSKSVSAQKASVKKKIKSRSASSKSSGPTLGSLGGNTFSLG